MSKILVIEDNLPLSTGLCFELDTSGYLTVAAYHCRKALKQDVLKGFDLGADDYVTKPFHMQILKRRVEVALRRGAENTKALEEGYDDGFLRLDFRTLTAVRNGEQQPITPNEYKLLKILTAHAGNLVTRQILLEKLWDCDGNYVDDHTLTVTMNRLRAKIEDVSHSYIRTVRGMGYIWTGEKL